MPHIYVEKSRQATRANINKPYTWSSFDSVINAWHRSNRFDGIGYVLTKNSPFDEMKSNA
jgi:primase-polymerase (primpol)-like protein